jgi:scyllo-inositol 2-dehydrogenase (NADP+)
LSINTAVVGLGKMGISHLAVVNATTGFKVTAMCDSAPLVGDVLSKYSGIQHFSDFDKTLALPDLQAVIIATPSTSHASMVAKALDRGLHVFCEKPLTLSADESYDLAKSAQQKGLVAQVGYHNRLIGTFGEVKRLLELGTLGRISHIQVEAWGPVVLKPSKPTWRSKAGQGGGCLYDYAAHPINLMNWYLGKPDACVGAILKSYYSTEVDDEVYSLLTFPSGVTGMVSVNWSDPSCRKMTTRVTIWGEGGRIYADRQELQLFLTGNRPVPEGYNEGWTVRYITDLTPPVGYYLRGEEYSAQIEAFGHAIETGAKDYVNDLQSAAMTDETMTKIRDAASGQSAGGATITQPARKRGLFGRLSRA